MWQPIEEGPRDAPWDGKPVILALRTMQSVPGGPYFKFVIAAWDALEGDGWRDPETDNEIEGTPVHWMPLPQPPTA